jgi:hypothetical protein
MTLQAENRRRRPQALHQDHGFAGPSLDARRVRVMASLPGSGGIPAHVPSKAARRAPAIAVLRSAAVHPTTNRETALYKSRATRKPRLTHRLPGEFQLRKDERSQIGKLFQPPPRRTRKSPLGGP